MPEVVRESLDSCARPRATAVAVVILGAVLLSAGCKEAPTVLEVSVEVETGVSIDAITITASAVGKQDYRQTSAPASVVTMRIQVEGLADRTPVNVQAEGSRGGASIVLQRAVITLRAGQVNSRHFDFTPDCAGLMCTLTQTCDRGACVRVSTDRNDGGTASGGIGGQTAAPDASGGQAGAVVAATGGGVGVTGPATGSGGATGAREGGQDAGGVVGTGGIVATGGTIGTGGIGTGGVLGTGGVSPAGGAGGRVASCQVTATQCSMNGVQTCDTAGQWSTAVPCGPNQACGDAVGSAKCTCNVDPVCKGVGKTCASMTVLATCMQDAQSCYYAASTSICTKGTCGGVAGQAACSCACAVGATECSSSTSLATCAAGPNSCNVLSSAACGSSLVCERLAPASCADPRWAEWPVPQSISPSGYTDNGDGTVTDNTTGLMWEKAITSKAMTQPAAVSYCATMATTGGYSDWRLPSKIELLSIVDYGRSNPGINTIFIGTAGANCWSSTPLAGSTSKAWFVLFSTGDTGTTAMTTVSDVRCVR